MTKPILYKQSYDLTDIDGGFSGNLLEGHSFDADGDTLTIANIDGKFVNGTYNQKGSNSFDGDFGTLVVFDDGTYTYTLHAGLNLKAGDSVVEDFTIKIRDTQGNYASSTVKFNIQGTPNEKPIAVDDAFAIAGGTSSGNLLANDSDPNGDILHVGSVIVNGTNYHITGLGDQTILGQYGTLVISDNGSFNYSYFDGVTSGTEKFAYKAHDGQNGEGHNTDYAIVTLGEVFPL